MYQWLWGLEEGAGGGKARAATKQGQVPMRIRNNYLKGKSTKNITKIAGMGHQNCKYQQYT